MVFPFGHPSVRPRETVALQCTHIPQFSDVLILEGRAPSRPRSRQSATLQEDRLRYYLNCSSDQKRPSNIPLRKSAARMFGCYVYRNQKKRATILRSSPVFMRLSLACYAAASASTSLAARFLFGTSTPTHSKMAISEPSLRRCPSLVMRV